jgi:hypothetical protein
LGGVVNFAVAGVKKGDMPVGKQRVYGSKVVAYFVKFIAPRKYN